MYSNPKKINTIKTRIIKLKLEPYPWFELHKIKKFARDYVKKINILGFNTKSMYNQTIQSFKA